MIGSNVGPYRIRSELGAGGMGTVYLAEAPDGGGRLAVKIVHPHLIATPGFFKRFLREAERGRKVTHENGVRTLDVGATMVADKQVNYMVMEYVEGKRLRELLRGLGTVPEALLREIALQTANSLASIHNAEIVHRDLEPENILITDDQRIRIMDLGVAKLQEASIAITKEGQFAGSLLYAAPEQFGRGVIGPAADLYSLGVLLYELATGLNPFREDDAASVIQAHLTLDPPRACERNPEVSLFLSEVIATLIAKAPGDRFGAAEALRTLLEEGEEAEWWIERAHRLHALQSHPPRIPVPRETAIHAREGDLQTLRDAWEKAKQGEGSTILFEGEAGIGKTRLLDEFVRTLKEADCHVLYGSYPPSGGLGGMSEAIIQKFGEAGLAQALRPYLTITPSLVPAFAALLKHESAPTGAEPLGGDALSTVTCHLMRALADERPTLWIIDDLHFSPSESRHLLLAMARGAAPHRVLIVMTARPGLAEADIAHFTRLSNFRRIALSRLGARDVIELLRDAFRSGALAEKLGGKIAYKSDGVPLFVFEMFRALKEGRLIAQQADGSYVQTQLITEIEVPSAVKDLIEARLNGLTKEQRAILDVGAVQGMSFEPTLVAAVLEEKKVRVLQEIAEIERRFGLVRGEATSCRFDQNQIHEVVYQSLLPELRAEYHTLLADARGEKGDPYFLAYHYLHGSRPEGAKPHVKPALEKLAAAYRNEARIELSDMALSAGGAYDGTERCELQIRKAESLGFLGQHALARGALQEALSLADATGGRSTTTPGSSCPTPRCSPRGPGPPRGSATGTLPPRGGCVRRTFEQILATGTGIGAAAVAQELAELLAGPSPAPGWTVIQPAELRSAGGATLASLPDGSILVGGENPAQELCTVLFVQTTAHIRAMRIEALPHPSHSGGGPGRSGPGHFHVAPRLFSGDAPVVLHEVVVTHSVDGFAHLDEPPATEFRWPQSDLPSRESIALLRTDVEAAAGEPLKLEIRTGPEGGANLGRFRLAISDAPGAYDLEKKRLAAAKSTPPWTKLAAAYWHEGDDDAIEAIAARGPDEAVQVGDLYLADRQWERAIAMYDRVLSAAPDDGVVLARRAWARAGAGQLDGAEADWFRALEDQPRLIGEAFSSLTIVGRFSAAAKVGWMRVERFPDDIMGWVQLAPVIVLAGDKVGYAELCDRLAQQFVMQRAWVVLDAICMVGALLPDGFDLARLPVPAHAAALAAGRVWAPLVPMGWATRALLAHRSGDAASAMQQIEKAWLYERQFGPLDRALALAVRALVHRALGRRAEARADVAEAARIIEWLPPSHLREDRRIRDKLTARVFVEEARALLKD